MTPDILHASVTGRTNTLGHPGGIAMCREAINPHHASLLLSEVRVGAPGQGKSRGFKVSAAFCETKGPARDSVSVVRSCKGNGPISSAVVSSEDAWKDRDE